MSEVQHDQIHQFIINQGGILTINDKSYTNCNTTMTLLLSFEQVNYLNTSRHTKQQYEKYDPLFADRLETALRVRQSMVLGETWQFTMPASPATL